MSATHFPKSTWFPTFHKTWNGLGFPGQLAVLTTTLIVLCLPIAIITLARPTDPRSQALDNPNQVSLRSVDQYQKQTPLATKSGCVIGGCSGELCSDVSSGPINSICLWKEEYACYKTASCARQANGQCGWTQTAELIACLREAGATQPSYKTAPTGASRVISVAPTYKTGICDRACPDGSAPDKLCRCLPLPTSSANKVPTPTCQPRPACLDAKTPCKIPQPIGGWCPTKPSPSPIAIPGSTSTEAQFCARAGATWVMFRDTCVDSCLNQSSERACGLAMTPGCECGPTKCWTGTACVPNPGTTVKPTTRPTTYTTPKPLPTTSTSVAQQSCARSNGSWKEFTNSCADTCLSLQSRQACRDVITPSCDCGSTRCWTGTACVSNPSSGTVPTNANRPTTFPTKTVLPTNPPAANYPPGNVCDLACPDGFFVTGNCMCQPLPPQVHDGTTVNNRPAAITKTLPAIMQNKFYLATIAAQDLDVNDKVDLKIDGLPDGLKLERCLPSQAPGKSLVSCSITGTTKTRAGNYTLTLRLTDSQGNTTTQEVTVNVIPPESWFIQFMNRFRSIVSLQY